MRKQLEKYPNSCTLEDEPYKDVNGKIIPPCYARENHLEQTKFEVANNRCIDLMGDSFC